MSLNISIGPHQCPDGNIRATILGTSELGRGWIHTHILIQMHLLGPDKCFDTSDLARHMQTVLCETPAFHLAFDAGTLAVELLHLSSHDLVTPIGHGAQMRFPLSVIGRICAQKLVQTQGRLDHHPDRWEAYFAFANRMIVQRYTAQQALIQRYQANSAVA